MRAILLMVLATGLASCATVFNHAAQPVAITPEFEGPAKTDYVRVLITSGTGTYQAALPGRFVVTPDLWVHATVKVVEPCFKPTEQPLPRHVTGWLLPDLIAGAAAPIVILFPAGGDVLDGTLWTYSNSATVHVEPVADFEACMAASGKNPGMPFPVTLDPVWADSKSMAKR
jgi:hypothetical protein